MIHVSSLCVVFHILHADSNFIDIKDNVFKQVKRNTYDITYRLHILLTDS